MPLGMFVMGNSANLYVWAIDEVAGRVTVSVNDCAREVINTCFVNGMYGFFYGELFFAFANAIPQ